MSAPGADELERFLAANPDVTNVELLLPDINGLLRGVRAPVGDLPGLCRDGAYMSASTMLLDGRGQLPEGLEIGLDDGDPDYPCLPVAGSFARVPWSRRPLGQCLVQMHERPGKPYCYDSRAVLQRVLQRYHEDGLVPVVALELEFYLLREDTGGGPSPRPSRIPGTPFQLATPQLHALEELEELDAFLEDVEAACATQGIHYGSTMSEGSPGQLEINLRHLPDAERACDHAILLRRLVRGVARSHGMTATFMAQPLAGVDGSGMHLHFSLQDGRGRNVFAGHPPVDRPDAWAPALRHAIAGLIGTLPGSLAILAPNANSYRRLGPGSFLTTRPSWGYNHRQVAVRIPPSDPVNARLEHRPPGADANPYLVMAALLAGAHHGMKTGTEPPPMVAEGERLEETSGEAPAWEQALDAFEACPVLADYLGADFCRSYARCRRLEAREYRQQVPDIDLRWYLPGL